MSVQPRMLNDRTNKLYSCCGLSWFDQASGDGHACSDHISHVFSTERATIRENALFHPTMDLITLAQHSVDHLAPGLPFLLDTGHGAAKKVGEAAMGGILELAGRLWASIRSKAESTQPALLEAAKDVADAPDDPDARGALRLQLRKLLEAQPALQSEIRDILGSVAIQQNTATASGSGAIAVGGSVSGSSFTTTANP